MSMPLEAMVAERDYYEARIAALEREISDLRAKLAEAIYNEPREAT